MKFIENCLVAATCFASVSAMQYSEEALSDEITALPGIPEGVTFKQFSGYVPLRNDNKTQMFYWLVEAEEDPENKPLVLWTNGGPGCSGLSGFLTEMGPFRPTASGNLTKNAFAWNKVANMVFIEQPLGVGFSYTRTQYKTYGDDQAAADNYEFVKGLLKKFPNFQNNEFYITSESYGGHYMPTLAKNLVVGGGVNFKGFAVGNPLTYMPYRNYGQYGTYAGHNLLPKPLFDDYMKNGCDKDDSSEACQNVEGKMDEITSGLDPYALDFPICTGDAAAGREERYTLLQSLRRANKERKRNPATGLGGYFPTDYQPCNDNYATTYLNRADVQAAIHAQKPIFGWSQCSSIVSMKYNQTDVNREVMSVYKWLIDNTKGELNILVYSGDDDAICATLGTQQWIWDLGYEVKSEWAAWKSADQIAGYHVGFDGFNFVSVHGAGHMVPSTRPDQALDIITRYLNNQW